MLRARTHTHTHTYTLLGQQVMTSLAAHDDAWAFVFGSMCVCVRRTHVRQAVWEDMQAQGTQLGSISVWNEIIK
jgi:hypothetical protein